MDHMVFRAYHFSISVNWYDAITPCKSTSISLRHASPAAAKAAQSLSADPNCDPMSHCGEQQRCWRGATEEGGFTLKPSLHRPRHMIDVLRCFLGHRMVFSLAKVSYDELGKLSRCRKRHVYMMPCP